MLIDTESGKLEPVLRQKWNLSTLSESFSLSFTALIFSVPNCSRSLKVVFDHPLPNMLNCIDAQQCSLVYKYGSEPSKLTANVSS